MNVDSLVIEPKKGALNPIFLSNQFTCTKAQITICI